MKGRSMEQVLGNIRTGQMDGIVLMPSSNLKYLFGLSFHPSKRLTLAFIPADGRTPSLVLPALEAGTVQSAFGDTVKLFTWTDAEGPMLALQAAFRQAFKPTNLTLGIEYTAMRVMELRALEHVAQDTGNTLTTIDVMPILSAMRMVKDEGEQAAMAESARIVEIALTETVQHIHTGVTERQLMRICSQSIYDAGAEGESFEAIVASGPNSANPHHGGSDRPFQNGDLIVVDCGAVYGGYASDITRTFALGEPSEEARRIYEVVKVANSAGKAAVHPGVSGEEIDRATRHVIEGAGYGQYFPHRTGHGLGIEVNPCHEPPDLVAGSTTPLVTGTTFTIEPGIYVEGVGGVRIEDDVVITLDGHRSFTNFDRELLIIPA